MTYRVCLLLAAATMLLPAEVPSAIAIRNAKVITVSGPVLDKATVVIRNGLIESVGPNSNLPPDAWVIDGEGLSVYPGLIDALSTLGMADASSGASAPSTRGGGGSPAPTVTRPARGPEDRPLNTSYLRAADQLSPADRRLEGARNAGFTGSVTFPMRGIFAGQGAVINHSGQRAGDMVISPSAGLYLTMQSAGFNGGFPGSLMGVIAYIRQIYLDAAHYKEAQAIYAAHPIGNKRPAYDKTLEGVLEAPRALLPAANPKEIDRMLHLAAELKLQAVLYGAQEAFRHTNLSKAGKTPVLVNLRWPRASRDADPERVDSLRTLETRDRAPSSPAALVKAGVPFAFYLGGLDRPSDIGAAVRKAITAGLSHADAVRAFTLAPAQIFGVADRIGSIEPGKIANLVVTSGDLFQDRTTIKYVFVDGIRYEPAPERPTPGQEATR
jgi:imidazolonepropionase-like amidohydrolase